MPVRYVKGDLPEEADAAAIREFDLQKRFHLTVAALSDRLGLTPPRCKALRDHLGIDGDETCRHVFEFGSQKHPRYSDKAVGEIKKARDSLDLEAIWESHRPAPVGRRLPACQEPGCAKATRKKGKAG